MDTFACESLSLLKLALILKTFPATRGRQNKTSGSILEHFSINEIDFLHFNKKHSSISLLANDATNVRFTHIFGVLFDKPQI